MYGSSGSTLIELKPNENLPCVVQVQKSHSEEMASSQMAEFFNRIKTKLLVNSFLMSLPFWDELNVTDKSKTSMCRHYDSDFYLNKRVT